MTPYTLRQATAEVTRLKRRIAEVGEGYCDIKFVKWRLSCMENEVKFIKSRIAEKTPTALEKWLTK